MPDMPMMAWLFFAAWFVALIGVDRYILSNPKPIKFKNKGAKMRITELPNPQIYLESIIEFDPWPFESDTVSMARDVVLVGAEGEVKRAANGFRLLKDDTRLGRLSDGRTAVVSYFYEPGTPIFDKGTIIGGKSTTARD